METHIKLGLVGFGDRGRSLLRLGTRRFPGVVAAVICDSDETRLSEAQRDYPDAGLFSNVDRMLDNSELDALRKLFDQAGLFFGQPHQRVRPLRLLSCRRQKTPSSQET